MLHLICLLESPLSPASDLWYTCILTMLLCGVLSHPSTLLLLCSDGPVWEMT